MSEEEKKAIKELTDAVNEPLEVFENVVDTFKPVNLEQCRIILNLIEKQQKEIEREKEYSEFYEDLCHKQQERIRHYKRKYISKNKIRELLKKYDKDIAWANADDHYYFVKYIKELLGE